MPKVDKKPVKPKRAAGPYPGAEAPGTALWAMRLLCRKAGVDPESREAGDVLAALIHMSEADRRTLVAVLT